MLRIPHCLDNRLIDGGKVVSPTHRPHFTPQKYTHTHTHTHTQCVHKVYSGFWKILARKQIELATCGLRQITAKLWKFFHWPQYTSMWAPLVARITSRRYSSPCHVLWSMSAGIAEIAHHTFTFGLSRMCSLTTCWFSVPHMRTLCLWTLPETW
jgi:hypothetical protein